MVRHVNLGCLVGVMPSVKRVSPCGVCMMGRFFVVSGLMMLSCLAVVTRGMRMVLCRLLVVLGCFLGHSGVSSVWWPVNTLTGNNGTPTSEKSFVYDTHFSRRNELVTVRSPSTLVFHDARGLVRDTVTSHFREQI